MLISSPYYNCETFRTGIEHEDPEIAANVMICLIEVTTYLLFRQMKSLEKAFLKEGGMRERMTKARIEQKKKGQ